MLKLLLCCYMSYIVNSYYLRNIVPLYIVKTRLYCICKYVICPYTIQLITYVKFWEKNDDIPRYSILPNSTFTELRGFHRAFATGVACQQGALTLPDTWFRPPFWDLLMFQLLRPYSSNLPCLYSTFHLEYPLVVSRFCPLLSISKNTLPFITWCSGKSNKNKQKVSLEKYYFI